MSKILTREAFENAIMVNGAIGGSTNAVVHLLAIAGRLGVKLSLDDWDRLGRDDALPRQPDAVGRVPDGGFLLRGRAAGRHPRNRQVAPQEGADGQRQDDLGQLQGRGQLQRRR